MLRPCKQELSGVPMPAREWIRLAELVAGFLLALAVYFSWRADRRDRSQFESELAATKQLLVAADARQHDRDIQLAQTLATLAHVSGLLSEYRLFLRRLNFPTLS